MNFGKLAITSVTGTSIMSMYATKIQFLFQKFCIYIIHIRQQIYEIIIYKSISINFIYEVDVL